MDQSSTAATAIADALAADLADVPEGHRLPSQRELVARFGASASTITQALTLLRQRNLVETRPGAGTFRSRRPTGVPTVGDTTWQRASLDLGDGLGARRRFHTAELGGALAVHGPDVIDLNGGYQHPHLQPIDLLASATARAARRPQAWSRPPTAGLDELRDWFAQDIGAGLGRHDVLIGAAGQGALATAMRALGQPGAAVILEAPTFTGTIAAAHAAGLAPVAVPMDARGMLPEHLDAALHRTGARLVVVQPAYQNPTGATMTPRRQQEIRQVARSHHAFVIEDDFARYLSHDDAAPLPPPMIADDPDGTVIHLRSLTKITSPNLRVGGIAARGPVMSRLRDAQLVDTMMVPAPLQHTALELFTASAWRRTRARMAAELGERRREAVAAVHEVCGAETLPVVPHGGYHLWLRFPEHVDGRQVANRALASGVAISAGVVYHPSGADTHPTVRISYVAAPSSSDVVAGIQRLGPILAELV